MIFVVLSFAFYFIFRVCDLPLLLFSQEIGYLLYSPDIVYILKHNSLLRFTYAELGLHIKLRFNCVIFERSQMIFVILSVVLSSIFKVSSLTLLLFNRVGFHAGFHRTRVMFFNFFRKGSLFLVIPGKDFEFN